MEFFLGLLLSRLLFTPEFLGRTYSDEMSAVRIESAISNALDMHEHRYNHAVVSGQQIVAICALLKEVARCRALRNKFAHYLWMRVTDEEITGHKMSGKPATTKKDSDSLKMSIAEIAKAHTDSYALVKRLSEIVIAIPSVPEKRNLTSNGAR